MKTEAEADPRAGSDKAEPGRFKSSPGHHDPMTKTVTLVDGKTTLLETEKITGIHDRGVQDGKPVVKIHRGSEPAIFVFSTEEDIASKTADITIDL